jgi:hypothetical protein
MKKIATLALAALAMTAGHAIAQPSVGVSVGIYQPGVYGRIDIGNYPQPALIYPQPVVIAPGPVAVYQRPIYMYVPPGHQKNWGKHCAKYGACGQPVYFVQEQWVEQRYEERHPGGKGKGKGNGKGQGHGKGHDKH